MLQNKVLILVEFSNGIQLFDKGHFVRLVTLVTHDSRNVIKVKFPISFLFDFSQLFCMYFRSFSTNKHQNHEQW